MKRPYINVVYWIGSCFFILLIIFLGIIFLPEILRIKGAVWRGITIGISTRDVVKNALGNPGNIQKGSVTETYIYEEKGTITGSHSIIFRFGVVQEIVEDPLIYKQEITLKYLIDKYGNPGLIEWSFEGPDRRTVIFPDAGILANVVASPLDVAVVTKIVYYRPMPLILMQLKFPYIFSFIDPFPNSDIVGYKDPWFGTSKQCRYKCD